MLQRQGADGEASGTSLRISPSKFLAQYADNGVLRSLGDVIESGQIDVSGIAGDVLESVQIDDEQFAIPVV